MIDSRNSGLVKRNWWNFVIAPIGSTSSAITEWKKFMTFCVDCPPNDIHCYGEWACVKSAISTAFATGWAYYQWAVLAIMVMKREEISSSPITIMNNGPLTLSIAPTTRYLEKRDGNFDLFNVSAAINGTPMFWLDLTNDGHGVQLKLTHDTTRLYKNATLTKRDWTDVGHAHDCKDALKYSYCPVHPEHHLTEQYDWDDIWAGVDYYTNDICSAYYVDAGDIDMNDTVQGGWRLLMGTGKLILEQDHNAQNNFEGCDIDTFKGIAR